MGAKFIEVEGWCFWAKDVKVLHKFESKARPSDIASNYHIEVVLEGLNGNMVFKFVDREQRDAKYEEIRKAIV